MNVPPKPFPEVASEPTRGALLAALAERDRELAETRARQTATAEILRVISQSPTDAQPVFESIVTAAVRLLGCDLAFMLLCDGPTFSTAALGSPEGLLPASDLGVSPIDPSANFASRAILAKEMLYLPDWSLVDQPAHERKVHELYGVNCSLYLPLLREGGCIGLLTLVGKRPGVFGPDEIAQAESLRDQAGIAIENARQFNETKEALERQTATAEILKVIAGSPSDVQPVLEAIAASAVRLVGGLSAAVWRFDDEVGYLAAYTPVNPAADAALKSLSPMPFASFPIFARLLDGEAVAVVDTEMDATLRDSARLRGYRSLLFTPLMSGRTAIGLVSVTRGEPGVFAPHHAQLLRSFADQAVIAIRNTQLFNDTQEALRQQTATADVLKVISRSAFDLQTVLETLIHSAVELCAANRGAIFLRDGEVFSWRAATGSGDEYAAYMRAHPQSGGRGSTVGRVILSGKVECIPDVLDDPEFMLPANALVQTRATLGAPLLREGKVEGVLVLTRYSPGPFTQRQIELVETFADQAVIAIENVRLFDEVQARTRELTESLEQQTAAAEILRVISSSPTDLQPVFNAIARSASELCEGSSSQVFLYRNGVIDIAAHHKTPDAALVGALSTFPAPPDPGTASGRAILRRAVIHIPDIVADPEYSASSIVKAGLRTVLSVPMLRSGEPIGVVNATRTYSRPFTDRQIELLKTFADQAVIAINNVGLFNETQEALKQQTATADVLKVISRSAFDLDAVLVTLIGSAISLCEATRGVIWLRKGEHIRLAAHVNYPEEWVKAASELAITPAANATTASGIAAFTGEVVNIDDMLADPRFQPLPEHRLGDYRGVLAVPMDRDGEVVGVIALSRSEARRFSDRQVALVTAFADQAVIAIENVRLFDEVQARTRDLSESLQQQTATAEVLKAISRSVFDLDTVLQTLIDTAVRLTRGNRGTIFIRHGDELVASAFHRNVPAPLRAYLAATTWRLDGDSHMARAAREGRVVHISDLSQSYKESDDETRKRAAFGAGLWAPLMRDGQAIGVFGVPRDEPIAFSDREIELVQTFADQAVIAIENSRLFEQLKARTRDLTEALQQQTATADVLKVISRSAFDLQAVLDTLVQSAQRLCNARGSMIFVRDGEVYRIAAHVGMPEAFVSFRLANPLRADNITAVGRVALTGDMVHLADALADPDIQKAGPQLGDFRAVLSVPLVREDEVVGIFALNRPEPGLFAPGQVKLVQTFADQAAIAIANVRLFNEVKTKTDDLSEALEQQTATSDVLKAISRTAFDLDTVLDTLISTAVRLCNANYGQIFRRHGDVYRYAASRMDVDPDYRRHELNAEITPGRGTLIGRVALENRAVSVADAWSDPEYEEKDAARLGNVRAMLGVPLMRAGEPIGAFALARSTPIPFTERQIELVTTFADQAVIAIENVRLFDEVQARTRDLIEALERQKASAEILRVISRSPTDVRPVFDAIVLTAARLFGCQMAGVVRVDGDKLSSVTAAWPERLFLEHELSPGVSIDPEANFPSRAVVGKRTIHCTEFSAIGVPEHERYMAERYGIASALYLPLSRGDECVGVFVLTGDKTDTFGEKDVALAESFRDQALIAIENTRLFNETQEALQQQTATADVLKVISRSAFDVQAVLDTLVESAYKLSGAAYGLIYLKTGEHFECKAIGGMGAEEGDALFKGRPIRAGRGTAAERVIATGEVQSIPDLFADPEFDPKVKAAIRGAVDPAFASLRSLIAVPMKRDDAVVGVIVIARSQTGLLPARQLELLQTFADQAVIAIENVRLFDEVQARTKELQESLERQQASAEILRVISASPTDVKPVFDAIALTAGRLFDCQMAAVFRVEGAMLSLTTTATRDRLWAEDELPPSVPIDPSENFPSQAMAEKRTLYVRDFSAAGVSEHERTVSTRFGFSSALYMPLLRGGECVGVFLLTAAKTESFTDKDIALAESFRDQAQIAIENTRLFHETQEALQQQTATADVLKVISRSAFGLKTVLQTLVDSAVRLCASDGVIYLRDGDVFRAEAAFGAEIAGHDSRNRSPRRPGRDSITGRVALSGRVEQIPDNQADPEFKVASAQRMMMRALLGVPLLRDGEVEGVFVLGKPEPGLFSDRTVELVRTFADQAVIAIQNVRLFDAVQAKTHDLEESLQLQTATSDVLKVISRSAFDLQTVFDTLIASAVELCGAFSGSICVRDGDVFRYTGSAGAGNTAALHDYLGKHPATPGRASMVGRVLLSGKVESIRDRLEDEEYAVPTAAFGNISRAFLGVPLLGKGGIEGALVLTREEPGYFTQRQIEIVQTFADQAVIAIENVRLFDQVQARTRELAASLDDLRKTQDRLIQSEKLASLGQLTAGIAHEIKNPLNFVNNFSALSSELIGELAELLEKAPLQKDQREEASELIGMVSANLEKVVQHGKRADSIVKNMLLHSREGSGERSNVKVNAMVEEALNLAYHGARAEKPGFNVTIAKSLAPDAGAADLYAQEMTRVLLNLISNGFYATAKRRQIEANGAYEPTITASTRDLGHSVEIAIRDNGTGIPEEVKAKMFNPFFTTKPAGEGTGLGLSLSHDIVVKQHGGTLEVSTEPGSYTQFTIVLPRSGQGALAKAGAAQ